MKSSHTFSLLALTMLMLLLSACANMSQADCETADWEAIGYEDGVSGYRDSQIAQHRQECSKHGITPDLQKYLAGHNEGTKKYCTKTNGFFLGTKGNTYNRNCPDSLVSGFLEGMADGKILYTSQRAMNSAEDALDSLYMRIENFEEVIADKNELMIADGLVRAERLELRQQIDELEYRMVELIDLIPTYEENFEAAVNTYENVKLQFEGYFRK